jgi:hypothetical protein
MMAVDMIAFMESVVLGACGARARLQRPGCFLLVVNGSSSRFAPYRKSDWWATAFLPRNVLANLCAHSQSKGRAMSSAKPLHPLKVE